MRPVWDDTIDRQSLAALDPGPGALDLTPDVLIVGGGAVGLATAVMCRRAGIDRVCVIERDRLAAGPSGSAAGGLSPGVHQLGRPAAFGALASRGLELLLELDAEWQGALDIRRLDWLIASDQSVVPGLEPTPGLELVDGDGARAIEPHLGDVGGAVVVRDQGWVHPLRLAAAFAGQAGAIATRVSMTGMTVHGGRVVRVETSAGAVSPGSVVLATGSATDLPGVPGNPVKGHLLVTAPAEFSLGAAVAGSILVMPLPGGRLLAGGTFEPDDPSPVIRKKVVENIRAELGRLVPAAGELAIDRVWCCFRPGTPDGMPILDRAPGLSNAFINVGHFRTGLLAGPAAGEALAALITGRSVPQDIEDLGLARFGLS